MPNRFILLKSTIGVQFLRLLRTVAYNRYLLGIVPSREREMNDASFAGISWLNKNHFCIMLQMHVSGSLIEKIFVTACCRKDPSRERSSYCGEAEGKFREAEKKSGR